jgi:hypothetical protein
MFRILTWIPGHDDYWEKARAGRFVNTSTANNTTHRTPIGRLIFVSLNVKVLADFQWIDSFMIFIFLTNLTCVA